MKNKYTLILTENQIIELLKRRMENERKTELTCLSVEVTQISKDQVTLDLWGVQ